MGWSSLYKFVGSTLFRFSPASSESGGGALDVCGCSGGGWWCGVEESWPLVMGRECSRRGFRVSEGGVWLSEGAAIDTNYKFCQVVLGSSSSLRFLPSARRFSYFNTFAFST